VKLIPLSSLTSPPNFPLVAKLIKNEKLQQKQQQQDQN